MQLHLDMMGGLAGDMFVACVLDAFPEHTLRVQQTVGLLAHAFAESPAGCRLVPFNDGVFSGSRFEVDDPASATPAAAAEHHHPGSGGHAQAHAEPSGLVDARPAPSHAHDPECGHGPDDGHDHDHHHAHSGIVAHDHAHIAWSQIRATLTRTLDAGTLHHAVGIFGVLADAEAQVHGVAVADVEFHEVGAWDSVADIAAAACLIDVLDARRWSVSAVPLGAGRVRTAHGLMPVPPPATAQAANSELANSESANLSVCIDTASDSAARDQKVAEAVAHREGVQLAVEHFSGGDGDDDGFAPKEFKKLIADKCKLVMGFPIDATKGSSPGLPADLMTTSAYGETGFVLVVPQGSTAKALSDLPAGTDVAVTYDTAPNMYFLDHKNVSPDVHTSDKETLETLASGKVKAAMVWGPTLQGYLKANAGAKLSAYPLDEPHARYQVVALYGAGGTAEAARFQQAVADMGGSGALDKTIASDADASGGGTGGGTTTAQPPEPAPHADASTLPALYTEAQAKQGAQKFSDNCEQCHGAHLEGRAGPALKGPNFASAASNFTVSDIFTIVSQNMPASNPGSLQHDDYVQIMAFLLQQNGYPAGAKELTFEDAGASKVALVYHAK